MNIKRKTLSFKAKKFGALSALSFMPPAGVRIAKIRELHGLPAHEPSTSTLREANTRKVDAAAIHSVIDRVMKNLICIGPWSRGACDKIVAYKKMVSPDKQSVESVYSDGEASLRDMLALRCDWGKIAEDINQASQAGTENWVRTLMASDEGDRNSGEVSNSEDSAQSPETPTRGELVKAAEKIEEAVREVSGDVGELRSIFSGPVPPPQLLKAYDDAVPGIGERIVTMAEKEGNHRRHQEQAALESEIRLNERLVNFYSEEVRRGQIFAVTIGSLAILAGTVAGLMGAQITGSLIGAGGVIGLVAVFIKGRKNPFTDDGNGPEA